MKLVRDKIPEIIRNNGEFPIISLLNDQKYELKLREKLQEEVNEFLESGEIEELADILEVLYALSDLKLVNKDELELLRQKKEDERGAFRNKIFLRGVNKKE
tara:strand:- start:141 stop:446 length:306 start_codon:yes stop_codon:yes gene_type:complete